MARKKLVKKNVVKREPNTMYFVDKEGDLWSTKMKTRRKKRW